MQKVSQIVKTGTRNGLHGQKALIFDKNFKINSGVAHKS